MGVMARKAIYLRVRRMPSSGDAYRGIARLHVYDMKRLGIVAG